eukprot:13618013-Alexandrium_andersonii.AAC.1
MQGAVLVQRGTRRAGICARAHHGGEGAVDSWAPPAVPRGGRAGGYTGRVGLGRVERKMRERRNADHRAASTTHAWGRAGSMPSAWCIACRCLWRIVEAFSTTT